MRVIDTRINHRSHDVVAAGTWIGFRKQVPRLRSVDVRVRRAEELARIIEAVLTGPEFGIVRNECLGLDRLIRHEVLGKATVFQNPAGFIVTVRAGDKQHAGQTQPPQYRDRHRVRLQQFPGSGNVSRLSSACSVQSYDPALAGNIVCRSLKRLKPLRTGRCRTGCCAQTQLWFESFCLVQSVAPAFTTTLSSGLVLPT